MSLGGTKLVGCVHYKVEVPNIFICFIRECLVRFSSSGHSWFVLFCYINMKPKSDLYYCICSMQEDAVTSPVIVFISQLCIEVICITTYLTVTMLGGIMFESSIALLFSGMVQSEKDYCFSKHCKHQLPYTGSDYLTTSVKVVQHGAETCLLTQLNELACSFVF